MIGYSNLYRSIYKTYSRIKSLESNLSFQHLVQNISCSLSRNNIWIFYLEYTLSWYMFVVVCIVSCVYTDNQTHGQNYQLEKRCFCKVHG